MKKIVSLLLVLSILAIPFTASAQQGSLYNLEIEMLQTIDQLVDYRIMNLRYSDEEITGLKKLPMFYLQEYKRILQAGDTTLLLLSDKESSEIKVLTKTIIKKLPAIAASDDCSKAITYMIEGFMALFLGEILDVFLGDFPGHFFYALWILSLFARFVVYGIICAG